MRFVIVVACAQTPAGLNDGQRIDRITPLRLSVQPRSKTEVDAQWLHGAAPHDLFLAEVTVHRLFQNT
jgi:hypothetical protein